MREKVLYVNLPKDVQYRGVIVTEDGRTGLKYTREISIPKPRKLEGGTEPYQKEGLPYWFCKIKDGRDEFMHIYVDDLTVEDLVYDFKKGKPRDFITGEQLYFMRYALKAISNKPKEGFWLPVYEPSLDEEGNLQFMEGKKPKVGILYPEWEEKFKEYSPENESCIASINSYFLLLIRWLKDGVGTLEQFTGNLRDIGHVRYSKHSNKSTFELTGKRGFGGLYGFVGNTCKIISYEAESVFAVIGTFYSVDADKGALIKFNIGGTRAYQRVSTGLMELRTGRKI